MSKGSKKYERDDLRMAVTQLFETETQRHIIDYALNTINDEQWYRTGTIADDVGKSRNAVTDVIQRKEGVIGPMIRFGVVEPKHNVMNMPNIPHYRKADSPVIDLLEQWNGVSLTELFATTTAQQLFAFFALEGSDEAYSVNQIRHIGPFGFNAVKQNIELLVDCGLVTEEDKPRTTAYRLDTDSEIYQFLGELNAAIMESAESYERS